MNVLYMYNIIVHQVGHLLRVVPGCTASKTKKKINEYIYLFMCSASTGKDSTRFFGGLRVVQDSVNIIIYRDGVVGIATGYELDRSG